ncbi:hypothetical protein GCM10010441_74140 [Kitasatospora paracochleata]|uniref:HEAT repeat protein n=1 Tax=Kitasatospora paracochleata TaxID=58354 RepID=A0ABT1IX01_9ACTN|nr:hypothetical protein [Kitasatospora paracochleata]MCP2309670.1 hypothetical protein [Kitasatospora paracochleata]
MPSDLADLARYAAALDAAELARGHLDGRIDAEETQWLAFLRRCDLDTRAQDFALLEHSEHLADDCQALTAGRTGLDRVWSYLDNCLTGTPSPEGRQEFLLDRAASGQGMDWTSDGALMGTDRPEEVDAALDRADPKAGIALIGLAVTHPDPANILPRVARGLAADDPDLVHQATVALGQTARLHGIVDRTCLDLLRRLPRGNEADDDLWTFVPRRRLPWWLWRHQLLRLPGR